jgi:hypothetical protein
MDICLFVEFAENATFDLYPSETISLCVEIDEHGRLIKGPVTVSAIMDELYRAFKIALCASTHNVFARKIKANAKAITRRKLVIAQKVARGEVVTKQERGKVPSSVGLNPGDYGKILYGQQSGGAPRTRTAARWRA